MRSSCVRPSLAAAALVLGVATFSGSARADETTEAAATAEPRHDPPVTVTRERRSSVLFGVGLGTAIAGFGVFAYGGATELAGEGDFDIMGTGRSERDPDQVRSGLIMMGAGFAMMAVGIPLAIYFGKKVRVPVTASASGMAIAF